MIGVIFQLASEHIQVNIDGTNVLFRTNSTNGQWATIDNLQLNYAGVLKEHPDLKDKDDWKQQAINRFKDKIKNMKTEKERVDYVISDLEKFGYKCLATQRSGFRVERFKNGI